VRYADDLLLRIVGAVELLIAIQKCIAHFLQSGLYLWVGSAGSTTIAVRSTVEFSGTVIREVPPRTTPIQFLIFQLLQIESTRDFACILTYNPTNPCLGNQMQLQNYCYVYSCVFSFTFYIIIIIVNH